MKDKKLPLRKCAGCNEYKPKSALFRLCRVQDEIILDLTYKAQGRGAYVCKDEKCLEMALKRKSFNRAFKRALPKEVIDSLYKELEDDPR